MFKKFLSLFLRIGLSALLLAWLFSKIDIPKTLALLRSADSKWLIVAFLVFILNNTALLVRWLTIMAGLGLKVSAFQATRSYLIGLFGNLFLPSSIGGDIFKALTLCRQSEERTKVIASVLLDRLSGFAAIILMAVVSFVFGRHLIGDNSLVAPIAALACVSMAGAFVLFHRGLYEWTCGIVNVFPKFKVKLMVMHDDIAMLKKNPGHGLAAIAWGLCSQALFILVFFSIARSLGVDVPFASLFIFVPLICIVSIVPSIGGLGVREAGTVYLFSKIGIASEISVGISLTIFIFMVIAGLTGAGVYVATLYSRRLQHPA